MTTDKPAYVIHRVDEDDVTVDWFFGDQRFATKVGQLLLVLIGWFFAALPVVITVSALTHRNGGGWWDYREGYAMFDVTMVILGVLLVFFLVGFLVLCLLNRAATRRHNRETTYHAERLALRLQLAEDLYAQKFGDRAGRQAQSTIRIEPYGDLETYELRDRYRTYGVD